MAGDLLLTGLKCLIPSYIKLRGTVYFRGTAQIYFLKCLIPSYIKLRGTGMGMRSGCTQRWGKSSHLFLCFAERYIEPNQITLSHERFPQMYQGIRDYYILRLHVLKLRAKITSPYTYMDDQNLYVICVSQGRRDITHWKMGKRTNWLIVMLDSTRHFMSSLLRRKKFKIT